MQTFLVAFADGEYEAEQMDEAEWADWLASLDWTFSENYAKKGAPHEYVVVHDDVPEEERDLFYKCIVYVRVNGHDYEFWGDTYTVCEIDGYMYWTMGNSVGETSVLNRKPVGGYDEFEETDYPQPGVNEIPEDWSGPN